MAHEVRQAIESELADAIESGIAAEQALDEAAGALTRAEKVFARLSNAKRSARRRVRKRRRR
jgi:hypothetical protein